MFIRKCILLTIFACPIPAIFAGCTPEIPGSGNSGLLGTGVDENADPELFGQAIVEEVEGMVPSESAKVVDVLPSTAGPAGSLVGLDFDDGTRAFLLGDFADDGQLNLTGACLEDAAGNLILGQTFAGNATTVTMPTGDSIEMDVDGLAMRLSFTLNSTNPPSVIAVIINEDGTSLLDAESLSIQEQENPDYNMSPIRLPRETALKRRVRLGGNSADCPIIELINRFRRTACFVVSLPQEAAVLSIDTACKGASFFVDTLRGTTPVPPNPFFSQPPPLVEVSPTGARLAGAVKVGISITCTIAKNGANVAGFLAGGPAKVACRLYSLANEGTRIFTEDGRGISSLVCENLAANPENLGLPLRPCRSSDRQCDNGVGVCTDDPDCALCGLESTCVRFCDPPDPDCGNPVLCEFQGFCCSGDRKCDQGCPQVDSDCDLCLADSNGTCVDNCFPPDPDCSNAVICDRNEACCDGDRRCDTGCPQEDTDCPLCIADADRTCIAECVPEDPDCAGVECVRNEDCIEPFREFGCLDNNCVLCTEDDHCRDNGLGAACRDNDCVECLTDLDCDPFEETCDEVNFACVPNDSGLFTIIGFRNSDGTLGGGPVIDPGDAQIQVSGSPTAPTISWSGIDRPFSLIVTSQTSLLYGIEGETPPDENGDTEQVPFAFSSIPYGTFGRTNTIATTETSVPPLMPGMIVTVAIAGLGGDLATLTLIVN